MKSKLSVLLFFCMFSSLAAAQWGVKGGADFSTFGHYSTGCEYKTGFHVGTTYDIATSRKCYFQPGLLFTLYGSSFGKMGDLDFSGDVSMYSVEVPLNFSFRPRLGSQCKLVTDVGLYAKYGLFGTAKYELEGVTITDKFAFGPFRRFDMGINLGLGMEYKNYSIGSAFQIGLTDVEEDLMSWHEVFRVSLGYRFKYK